MELKSILLSTLILILTFNALRANVELCVAYSDIGEETFTANVQITSTKPVLALQFSVGWDLDLYEFERIVSVNEDVFRLDPADIGDFMSLPGQGAVPENRITFLTIAPGLTAVGPLNQEILFSIEFRFKEEVPPFVEVLTNPTRIEVIGETAEEGPLPYLHGVCGEQVLLNGKVTLFEDDQCSIPFGDLDRSNWFVIARSENHTAYSVVAKNGTYFMALDPGNYEVELVPKGGLWAGCDQELEITIPDDTSLFYDMDVSAYPEVACPRLTVDLLTPLVVRCAENYYFCNYCNSGTSLAEDAYIEIDLDENMEDVTIGAPFWSASEDSTRFRIELGDLPPGTCGDFIISFDLSCDAEVGESHCTEARIFPNDPCEPTSDLWSGASIEVEAICDGDEIKFTIVNTGSAGMMEPLPYVVIQDIVMLKNGTFELGAGEEFVFSLPATGGTFRLEAEQEAFHPGKDKPTASVEGCLENGSSGFGLLAAFAQNDADPFVDVDCQNNVGSYSSIEKRAQPEGFDVDHKIYPNTDIEYTVLFQNTGNFPAFNIRLVDSLSPALDPETIEVLWSSHPYELKILAGAVVEFQFPNVSLPDSTSNEEESKGFVKFRISQKPDLPDGTVIESKTEVFFDANDPVQTNTVFHTVFTPVLLRNLISDVPLEETRIDVSVYPNPTTSFLSLDPSLVPHLPLQLDLYDLHGRRVLSRRLADGDLTIEVHELPSALYFYRLSNQARTFGTGKVSIQ